MMIEWSSSIEWTCVFNFIKFGLVWVRYELIFYIFHKSSAPQGMWEKCRIKGRKSREGGSAKCCEKGSAKCCEKGSAKCCEKGSAKCCEKGSAKCCEKGSEKAKVKCVKR